MDISIDAERVFYKNHHLFIKTLNKLGIERYFLNLIRYFDLPPKNTKNCSLIVNDYMLFS